MRMRFPVVSRCRVNEGEMLRDGVFHISGKLCQNRQKLGMVAWRIKLRSTWRFLRETCRPQRRTHAIYMDDPSNTLLSKVLPLVDVVFERVWMVGTVHEEVVAHRFFDVDVVCLFEWKSQ